MQVRRFAQNPIIRPDMDGGIGDNINGPSLIKVPDWIPDPLGKYYLYFAHHHGANIRLAYSDRLEGPWKIHAPGVLDLKDSLFDDHIASPDVHVLDETREVRMYFHGCCVTEPPYQVTRLALSPDGLHFKAQPEILGSFYWRVFRWRDQHYVLEMPGTFRRSTDGVSAFEKGPTLFTRDMRHSAVQVIGENLHVFYTNARDCPERILWTTIDLAGDWRRWKAATPQTLLKPETGYEGADCPLEASARGAVYQRVRQLRDPCIFEEDGKTYLLYCIAGEQGIAIGELIQNVASTDRTLTQRNPTPLSARLWKRIKKPWVKAAAKIGLHYALVRNAEHARHFYAARRENPPAFIVGCGHSGTSLLLAVLGAHSRILAVPYESAIAYDYLRNVPGRKADAMQQLRHFDQLAISEKKMRWVEKTPAHILVIDDLLRLCPEAAILLIIRDGRDVACSIQDRTGSLETGIGRWMNDNRTGQIFWKNPRVYRLKYETLVEDFQTTITGVLQFLGEKFEPRLFEYNKTPKLYYGDRIQKPPDAFGENHDQYRNWQINQPLFDGRGRWKRLSEPERDLIKGLAGEMLIEYGYARDNDW